MNCKVCKEPVATYTVVPDMCDKCTEEANRLLQGPTHGLGDKVATAAKALGFKQTPGCGCARRQKALNNVNLEGPAGEVAKGLLQAILNPPKE